MAQATAPILDSTDSVVLGTATSRQLSGVNGHNADIVETTQITRSGHYIPIQAVGHGLISISVLLDAKRRTSSRTSSTKAGHQCGTGNGNRTVISSRGSLVALHCPILRMPIDRGTVAPVERVAVELRWAAPKLFQR
jgi:hypothetical protein